MTLLLLLACPGHPPGGTDTDTDPGGYTQDTSPTEDSDPTDTPTGPWSAGNTVYAADVAASSWVGDLEWVAGMSVAVGDVAEAAGVEIIVGAPSNADYEGTGPMEGRVYVVDGGTRGEHGLGEALCTCDDSETVLDYLGARIASGVDLDGDGWDELVIGAPDGGHAISGAAYLLHGPVAGAVDLNQAADAIVYGLHLAGAGSGVGLGDFDGDGHPDVAVSSNYIGVSDAMAEVGVFGDTLAGDTTVADAPLRYIAEAHWDTAGFALAVPGDLSGDGIDDAALGAELQGEGAGRVYLLTEPHEGVVSLADADAAVSGVAGAGFGQALAPAGDLDGDGRADLVIGAYEEAGIGTWAGAIYVLQGGALGVTSSTEIPIAVHGEHAYDMMGSSATGPADLDGDGQADLVAAATGNSNFAPSPGVIYVFTGPISGPLDPAGDARVVIEGEVVGERFGAALAVGDVDADGRTDLVVGGPYHDGPYMSGKAWLFLGSALP